LGPWRARVIQVPAPCEKAARSGAPPTWFSFARSGDAPILWPPLRAALGYLSQMKDGGICQIHYRPRYHQLLRKNSGNEW